MSATTLRLRYISDVRVSNVDKKAVDGEVPVRLCNYTDVYYQSEITAALDFMAATATPGQISAFGLKAGDSIITKDSETASDIAVPAFVPRDLHGVVCGYHLAQIRPRQELVEPRYLSWSLQSDYVREQFEVAASGVTRYGLTYGAIKGVRISVPDLNQQRRIADFLDDQVTRIDQVMDLRRRQMGLLAAQAHNQILAELRGQGGRDRREIASVAWLGPLPTEWPVVSVSSQFEVLLGKMLNEERTRGDRMRPYLRNTNVQWDRIDTDDLKEMDFPMRERSRFEVRPGDLLVCEGGQPGRAAIWNGQVTEIYYQKALHRARPRASSLSRWLFYCLRAAVQMKAFASSGEETTIAHLTGEQLRCTRFPFPERAIQEAAVSRLDRFSDDTRGTVELLERSNALLAERKRSLITAAVTGEFDVSTASTRASDLVTG